jgi:cbb3-type cytochrome oxidase maturation protein
MDILFLLIPLSVVLALVILGALAWAVWRGQFDAVDAEGERILHGD